ncbi:hypothetical protein SEA_TUCK_65 [Arthrobacter phage Tuck]|uniref:Uncharacterized protein n=2 Tax=Yangvirus TaxID=2733221 RepID=A0A9E8M9G6_9CAUD|nr:hypothetical protein PQD82_gp65 [Arthrobacter phage Phives]QOP65193.1 hypothetical protein SEA_PHIVES_66 [Arthrobacter phage Phives]WAB10839.1 hypothetical protein SEA_TUCK_65 [Arthrobacter phage Tuck]
MPESPVCTCIIFSSGNVRYVRVFDPYCQIDRHRAKGTFEGAEPEYGRAKE